jgi:hypothetical protein
MAKIVWFFSVVQKAVEVLDVAVSSGIMIKTRSDWRPN